MNHLFSLGNLPPMATLTTKLLLPIAPSRYWLLTLVGVRIWNRDSEQRGKEGMTHQDNQKNGSSSVFPMTFIWWASHEEVLCQSAGKERYMKNNLSDLLIQVSLLEKHRGDEKPKHNTKHQVSGGLHNTLMMTQWHTRETQETIIEVWGIQDDKAVTSPAAKFLERLQ